MSNPLNEKQIQNYEKVSNYLDIVFLAPDTVNLLKFDESFQNVIAKDIQIVAYYENNFSVEEKKAHKFMNAFYYHANKRVEITDDASAFADDDSNLDAINYTDVFLNNLIGKTVTEIGDSLKSESLEREQQEAIKEEKAKAERVSEEEKAQDDQNAGYSASNNPQSDEDVFERNGYSMHDVADQLVQQQAAYMLNRNIATGKVYAFVSKPKIIPIMKWLTTAFMLLILAFSIAAFAVLMCTNNKLFIYAPTSISSSGQITSNWQSVQLQTPFPFQLLMILFIVIMVVSSMLRNNKNDNFKFRYSWGWMIFYVIMILLVTLIASGVQQALVFNFDNFNQLITATNHSGAVNPNLYTSGSTVGLVMVNGHQLDKTTSYAYKLIVDWRILQFVIYALIVAIVICMITGGVFNPKRDMQRMQELLNVYANEIRNGQVDSDDLGGNPFGPFGRMFFYNL
ncbi:hypothetical protein [Ureaplasma ceti]|uniref:Uncharacterized protein n=1 Tax=Ureaplasma ceti TaxID=3119530 RepID=A0ABP9U6C3_9BACT